MNVECGTERAVGERNDCTVHAIASACGVSYNAAHKLLEAHGRKRRRGFAIMLLLFQDATPLFGYTARKVADWKYCKGFHAWGTLREAILACGQKGRYIVRVPHHLLAIVDGKVHDVAGKGTRVRVTQIWKMEAPGDPPSGPLVKPGPEPATFEQARARLPRRRRVVCCNGHEVTEANAATWALGKGIYRCARCFEDYRALKQPRRPQPSAFAHVGTRVGHKLACQPRQKRPFNNRNTTTRLRREGASRKGVSPWPLNNAGDVDGEKLVAFT